MDHTESQWAENGFPKPVTVATLASSGNKKGTVPAGQVDIRREEMRERGGTGPYGKGEKGAGDITTGRGEAGQKGRGLASRSRQPATTINQNVCAITWGLRSPRK